MNVLNLSKFFKFKCCETDEHSEWCFESWNRLKVYFENYYIDDLYTQKETDDNESAISENCMSVIMNETEDYIAKD